MFRNFKRPVEVTEGVKHAQPFDNLWSRTTSSTVIIKAKFKNDYPSIIRLMYYHRGTVWMNISYPVIIADVLILLVAYKFALIT